MQETNFIERTIRFNDFDCKVSAFRKGKTWHARGDFTLIDCNDIEHTIPIDGDGARTFEAAFRYWESKAKVKLGQLLND